MKRKIYIDTLTRKRMMIAAKPSIKKMTNGKTKKKDTIPKIAEQ